MSEKVKNCENDCPCNLFGSLQCDQVWADYVEKRLNSPKVLEKRKKRSISKKLAKNEQK